MKDVTIRDLLPEDPMGLNIWRNPRNSVAVIDLHYTADPQKRTREWRDSASAGMPVAEWNREYEKSWETFEGKPVYGADFRPSLHVLEKRKSPEVGLPIMRGWDFGLTPACVFGQMVGRRLYILDEICETNMGAIRFVPQVLEFSNLHYPGFMFFDFIDPAGFNRHETEETSCADIMRQNRIRPVAGELTYEKRLGSVIRLLTTMQGGHPLIQLNPMPHCKMLNEGFRGAYHYPDMSKRGVSARMDRPVKNEASHPHDALQYLASKCNSRMLTQPTASVHVPTVHYGFSRGRNG